MAMLTDLRQKSQSFIIYILFGILIVVFVSFGPGTEGCGGGRVASTQLRVGWAAEVNGEEIDQREVEAVLRRQVSDIRDDAEVATLRRQVLMQLIDLAQLEQRARASGLAVSDDELNDYIMDKERNPDFPFFADRDGKFDYKQYTAQVQQNFGTNIATYRKLKEQELVVRNYLAFLEGQVKVSEPEVREAWERAERKWNLEYVAVPAEAAAQVPEPTAEEGAAFAAANADKVKAYYDEHKKEFDRGKEVHIRRILVKVPEGGDAAAKDAAKKKAEALLAEARAPGADFAKLAREKSEDYYKDYDGDMGWQAADNTNEHDFAIYDKLAQGQISDVVDAPIGFWFVKVEEIRPAVKKSLDEARDEIGRLLAREEARKKVARGRAEALLAKAQETGSLQAAVAAVAPAAPPTEGGEAAPADPAAPTALEVRETGLFSADRPAWDRIPGIGESKELAKRLPDLTAEKALVDTVVEADDKFVVARLKERVEPDASQFAGQKTEVEDRLRRFRQMQLFGSWEILLFGPAQQRDLFLKFSRPALLASLADPTKDANIRINDEAFPPPAPAKPADSQAALK